MSVSARISPGLVLPLCGVFSIVPRCYCPVRAGNVVVCMPTVNRRTSGLVLSLFAKKKIPVCAVPTSRNEWELG
jgi:hypothetical protein